MNHASYRDLMHFIDKNHSFRHLKGKRIKYVDCSTDMRTGKIFSVTLRGLFGEKVFWQANENKDRDLYTWIINWLEDEE